MNPLGALAVVLVLVAVATVTGALWRSRQGRIRSVTDAASNADSPVTAADVASEHPFGANATLLQFSTEFCAKCPGVSRLLAGVAAGRPGVAHFDVDLTHRADLASRFSVLQTPTTLVLDGSGRVRARVGGVPRRHEIDRHLDDLAVVPS